MTRFALVSSQDIEQVRAYLPANYTVRARTPEGCVIGGTDNAGWTLDGYVLPRLASGLLFGEELELSDEEPSDDELFPPASVTNDTHGVEWSV